MIAQAFTEGKINISIDIQGITHSITYPETEIQYFPTMDMNSMSDYTEEKLTEISWIKNDGTSILLMSKKITYKRNKLTTITIKAKDNSTSSGVNISTENTEMTNGDNFIINEKGEIITEIIPQS